MQGTTRITLDAPAPFDFARTACSHGWVMLAPNAWDAERRAVERVHRLATGKVVLLEIGEGGRSAAAEPGLTGDEPGAEAPLPAISVTVHHDGRLSKTDRTDVARSVSHMFRLDEDLSHFYALCAERGREWRGVTEGLGRLLRSPTAFEDVVKTILTTNVQWGGTARMARELVQAFGEPWPGDAGRRAFPVPEAIAEASPEAFAGAVGFGYRAPYVHELARRVASGDLDLEALAASDLPTPALERELRAIKGVGPYAAATLLMLLGRYDGLAVDSVFRDFVGRKYFGGERPPDAELRAIYEPWGRWKFLAYWFDLWTAVNEEEP